MIEAWSDLKRDFLACTGHALALGGPGSGKTHVALVKARDEIRSGILKPSQKILFLSFARPTVARIIEKASELISREDLKQLEVSTYHGFAWNILRSHAYLLNGRSSLKLMPPPEAAAHLTDIDKTQHEAEKRRLFEQEGRLHFDLFAGLVSELFSRSDRLGAIFSDTYPIIIFDEFQDTNSDEWALVRQLGIRSRLIALADPEQRIYEFRGAEPKRVGDFLEVFGAAHFDFAGENYRSSGTDIATYGNDLLTGANKGKTYQQVKIVRYNFMYGKNLHFSAKAAVCSALGRLKNIPNKSIAILVPSRRLMLELSDYLSSSADGLPELHHDVAMDAEPPALAAGVIAILLVGGAPCDVANRLIGALQTHIRGRRGGRPTPQAELDLAGALTGFIASGKIRGTKRQQIVSEVQRISELRRHLQLSGDPSQDWLQLSSLLASSTADALRQVAMDARYLRLLHRGSVLRANLGALWRAQGGYNGAEEAVRSALLQEHFAAAQKDWRGIHLMTIHKSKGKEFDEVIVYDGLYQRIAKAPQDPKNNAQDLLALRVGVTRAIRRTTIVTPKRDSCPFL
ncbi:ATP-dependent helicase [Pseudomonas syringae]|uniref:UvrD-helicase domain-containing protein n=1 Tax=Pseudomonas syringae TaxID=317 RepID=UPI0010137370|nr:ATP-dependent helicase [Pseudomonas syringae]MBI6560607.1 ATP-dependent helicase [Pseudomonas syringae]MBI6572407.1 ATP-dependent helicase [Pseudomonas syringae]MBI6589132.1 ATP-dependent helicase [Pseudomonas syringae]MBI6593689.1 ATP-dependent helicase [Pseudomonas syringae]MDC6496579.1 ATP-dependent helicase [Pseudomonas syringae]